MQKRRKFNVIKLHETHVNIRIQMTNGFHKLPHCEIIVMLQCEMLMLSELLNIFHSLQFPQVITRLNNHHNKRPNTLSTN